MNEVQSRLCIILREGLFEVFELGAADPPRFALIDSLAGALYRVPKFVYNSRRLSLRRLKSSLLAHGREHGDCPYDYLSVLLPILEPRWKVWNASGIRPGSMAGDRSLNEAQERLLAVMFLLFVGLRLQASQLDAERVRRLVNIAHVLPDVESTRETSSMLAPLAPFRAPDSPDRKMILFAPLDAAREAVVERYLQS